MNCENCLKKINKSNKWMVFNTNKYLCSYICSNIYGSVGWDNIVNKHDFMKYPIPYINFDKGKDDDFIILSDYELNKLSHYDKYEYNIELNKLIYEIGQENIYEIINQKNEDYFTFQIEEEFNITSSDDD
jgi:hypothetical protein